MCYNENASARRKKFCRAAKTNCKENFIMAKKTDGTKKNGVEANAKALKFQEFLMDNDINVFSTESVDDEYQTVMFRSRVEAKGQRLPAAVIIDTSIFTIIRTQMATGIGDDKRERVQDYINGLNTRYKIFKYYLRENGTVYLDICLPFEDDNFDGKMVQLMLSILIRHLEEVYEDFMECVWQSRKKEEK